MSSILDKINEMEEEERNSKLTNYQKSMKKILESTGYSYSGISDVIHNAPELQTPLLIEIDSKYQSLKKEMAELEEKLEKLKAAKALMVSCFMHFHAAMRFSTNTPLVFMHDDTCIKIKVYHDDNIIDYEDIKLTVTE